MTAIATAIPAGTYTSDPVHSSTGFAVKHMLATFRGSFAAFDATLTADEDGRARLVGSVPVDTVVVKDENLVAHLQSPEFFDAEQYPRIGFESTDIAIEDTIVGPVEDPFGNTKVGLHLEMVVDRTKFGLNWNAPLPKGGFMLANDVTLSVDLELVQG